MRTKHNASTTIAVIVLMMIAVVLCLAAKRAERFVSSVYYTIDSTGSTPDTFTLYAGTSSKLMQMTIPSATGVPFSRIDGQIGIYYYAVDTGTAGTKADTTKDTVACDLITQDIDGKPTRILASTTFTMTGGITASTITSAQYWAFTVPKDSVVLDQLYLRFRTRCMDSTATKARLAAKIRYGVDAALYVR